MTTSKCVRSNRPSPSGRPTYARKSSDHRRVASHDEALRDFKRCLESAENSGAGIETIQELRRSVQMSQQNQRVWAQNRDHAQTLELPTNLGQLTPEKQCNWIKKQHRKLARKWHPDKYRGNQDRGARKMRERSERSWHGMSMLR